MLVLTDMNMATDRRPRQYRMRKRAESAAETGERIVQATIQLHMERFHDQITLDDIAQRAGVTVQTVLRRFGSKDELIERAADHMSASVLAQRGKAPIGDVEGAVSNLLEHYDEWGPAVLRLLSQEDRVPQLHRFMDRGRGLHAEWVRNVFAPFLDGARDSHLLHAKLVALTDVYVWKLLHLDLELDRAETGTALTEMVSAVLKEGTTA